MVVIFRPYEENANLKKPNFKIILIFEEIGRPDL